MTEPTIVYNPSTAIDLRQFQEESTRARLDPKKVVFLFPGNATHHGPGTKLFTRKSGGGLGIPAGQLSDAGFPVLSLPTTNMEQWSTNRTQQATVQGAIADMYRAAGAGYSLMLPIRAHFNTNYFDQGLQYEGQSTEPSFWGLNATTPNKPLANHYTTELDKLHKFLTLSAEEKLAMAQSDPTDFRFSAYLNGKQMQPTDPWLQTAPVVARTLPPSRPEPIVAARRAAIVAEPIQPIIPASRAPARRQPIIDDGSGAIPPTESTRRPHTVVEPSRPATVAARAAPRPTPVRREASLKTARELLNDYTCNNSSWNRFWSGHWNRHHAAQVDEIVKKIDNQTIKTQAELKDELAKIRLVNPNGTLAERIRIITEASGESIIPQGPTRS